MVNIATCSAADLLALRKTREYPEGNGYLQVMKNGDLKFADTDDRLSMDDFRDGDVKFTFYIPGADDLRPADVVLSEDVTAGILDDARGFWARGDVGYID